MVVIAAGLAAIPRETCWRRPGSTAPTSGRCSGGSPCRCWPRCSAVVLVTLIINVLKIFDLVFVIAPGSSQRDANVIALQMWKTAFGVRDFGARQRVGVSSCCCSCSRRWSSTSADSGGNRTDGDRDGRTAERTPARRPSRESSARSSGRLAHGPVNVFLLVVALFWLVPDDRVCFVSSLRTAADNGDSRAGGRPLDVPAQLTLDPYQHPARRTRRSSARS